MLSDLDISQSLLQFKSFKEFPNGRVGTVDKAAKTIMPAFGDVRGTRNTGQSSIPLIPGPLVERQALLQRSRSRYLPRTWRRYPCQREEWVSRIDRLDQRHQEVGKGGLLSSGSFF